MDRQQRPAQAGPSPSPGGDSGNLLDPARSDLLRRRWSDKHPSLVRRVHFLPRVSTDRQVAGDFEAFAEAARGDKLAAGWQPPPQSGAG